jgi:hypothetical protein
MASICGSPCTKDEVQLAKIVCMVTLDEVDLLDMIPIDFVSQKIEMTSCVGSDTHQEITKTLGFAKDSGQKFTPSFGFAKDIQHERIGMNFGSFEQTQPIM